MLEQMFEQLVAFCACCTFCCFTYCWFYILSWQINLIQLIW